MSISKALGLGVLTALAIGAIAVANAGAVIGGHFEGGAAHLKIEGFETSGTSHVLHFNKEGGAVGERIGCDSDEYNGTTTAATVTEIKIVPAWKNCYTTGSPATKFDIDEKTCFFKFTVRSDEELHNTAHVECATAGDAFEITHPNCTITVPPQTVSGVSYKNVISPGAIHEVTLTSTVKGITAHYHAGICIFLGTTHSSEMVGQVTVRGTNNNNEQRAVTAT